MTNETLLIKLITLCDAFERELNAYKETTTHSGVLNEQFLDEEISLLFDLIEEVGKFDPKDDRISMTLFDDDLNAADKYKKMMEYKTNPNL